MAARYNPKTLAKTLAYILYHSPGEYGLFWDQNRTMPWKELYWALQEDPSLRFVRESHFREFEYLGIDVPVLLEGNLLRLKPDFPLPEYALMTSPPARLYYACHKKRYTFIREHGLTPSNRTSIPIASDREFALRMGMRRESDPLLIDILSERAGSDGVEFRKAGPTLYLVNTVPPQYLLLPLLREGETATSTRRKKQERISTLPESPQTYGSFLVGATDIHNLPEQGGSSHGTGKRKTAKNGGWKKEARKERHKRSI